MKKERVKQLSEREDKKARKKWKYTGCDTSGFFCQNDLSGLQPSPQTVPDLTRLFVVVIKVLPFIAASS